MAFIDLPRENAKVCENDSLDMLFTKINDGENMITKSHLLGNYTGSNMDKPNFFNSTFGFSADVDVV